LRTDNFFYQLLFESECSINKEIKSNQIKSNQIKSNQIKMLDKSNILLSRPRPPARKSLSRAETYTPNHHTHSMPSSQQPDKQLTDSPLSQLTKVLPPGTLQFSASNSFIDAWSCEQEEQQQQHEPIQQEITHEWVEAKTREELENLLLAADRVIRERERGKTRASLSPSRLK
jgi:hypothetical protein